MSDKEDPFVDKMSKISKKAIRSSSEAIKSTFDHVANLNIKNIFMDKTDSFKAQIKEVT